MHDEITQQAEVPRPARPAKIGLIRVAGGPAPSIQAGQEELLSLFRRCLDDGTDLVFTPESYQYRTARKTMGLEELVGYADDFRHRCRELAREYKAYVAPWDYHQAEDGCIYNSVCILDRQGKVVGRYFKSHITYGETARGLSRGTEYPVFDLDIGRVGVMICFDNYFPEVARMLALNGAQLILFPLWGDTMRVAWDVKVRARALDHSVYIASCCVDQSAYTGIVGPEGEMICRLDERGAVRVQEIDLARRVISRTSGRKDQFEDYQRYLRRQRNPASYSRILEPEPATPWEEILIPPPSRLTPGEPAVAKSR